MLLGKTAEKLREVGVQTLGVVATNAERARLYYRFRPPRVELGADPDLATHRAYGLPQSAVTPEILQTIRSKTAGLARERGLEVPEAEAKGGLNRLDGFEPVGSDSAEAERHQLQFVGQFLLDREGIVRWANVECAREGLAGLDKFPTDEEFLTVARML